MDLLPSSAAYVLIRCLHCTWIVYSGVAEFPANPSGLAKHTYSLKTHPSTPLVEIVVHVSCCCDALLSCEDPAVSKLVICYSTVTWCMEGDHTVCGSLKSTLCVNSELDALCAVTHKGLSCYISRVSLPRLPSWIPLLCAPVSSSLAEQSPAWCCNRR